MTIRELYDYTSIAPAACSAIHMIGTELYACTEGENVTRAEMSDAVKRAAGELAALVMGADGTMKQMAQDTPNWQASHSLDVALTDARVFLAFLNGFDGDLQEETDAEYAGALCDLSMDMLMRDHAERVANTTPFAPLTVPPPYHLTRVVQRAKAKAQRSAPKRAPAKARPATWAKAAAKPKARAR